MIQDNGESIGRMDWKGNLFATGPDLGYSSTRGSSGFWIFNPYLLLLFRLVLAAVFIYAAFQKIGKPLMFADEIRMYRIMDIGPPLFIVAVALPWIELFCGISFLTGLFIRGAALVLLVLNGVFLIAVSIRTGGVMNEEGLSFTKVYFDCGCGFGATYAWKKLVEDSLFFIFSLILLVAPTYRFVLNRSWRKNL